MQTIESTDENLLPPRTASSTAARKGRPPIDGSTRRRIVDCSIRLANEHGFHAVTIHMICGELQISPGNLTYYFKRKEDLTRAALDMLKDKVTAALEKQDGLTSAQDIAESLVRVSRTVWEFRFFFNALAHLAGKNDSFRSDYAAVRSWVVGTMVADLQRLKAMQAFVEPPLPDTFMLLAENIWALLLNWVLTEQILRPNARLSSRKRVASLGLPMWSLCHRWAEPQFSAQMLEAFESLASA